MPLDDDLKRRCKHAWEDALCPDCGEIEINAGDGSLLLWCSNYRYTFTFTCNTPLERRTLAS